MTEKFTCDGCIDRGVCCRNFGAGVIDNDLLEKHKELESKGPVFSVMSLHEKKIAMYGWELDKLRGSTDIKFNTRPRTVLYDLKREIPLVLTWNLDHDDCPFLSDKSFCKVYDNRMMHCRIFPLSRSGPGGITKINFSSLCPSIIVPEIKKEVSVGGYIKIMYDVYGEVFLWSVQRDIIISWLKYIIKQATQDGLIRPATNRPIDWMERKLRNKKPIDILKHLKSSDANLKTIIDEQIEKFYTLENAKSMVNSQIE